MLARARPPGRSDYPAADARLQRAAYPDIGPLQVNAPAKLAYDVALSLVTKRKWLIADARAPAGRREGAIEATARTPIMGFRDDVAIRITPTADGARIDVRSASRFGVYDFGANAARVRSLLEDLDDAVSSAPEPGRSRRKRKRRRPNGNPSARRRRYYLTTR